MMIGTLNVRTVRLAYKQQELSRVFSDSGLEILGIQEHRIVYTDTSHHCYRELDGKYADNIISMEK